jgi:hypothetical protein
MFQRGWGQRGWYKSGRRWAEWGERLWPSADDREAYPKIFRTRTPDGDVWTIEEELSHEEHHHDREEPGRVVYPRHRFTTPEEIRRFFREAGLAIPPEFGLTGPARPRWEKDSGTLRFGDEVIRQFKRRDKNNNQIRLINAFETAGWPEEPIPDPFGDEGTLDQTIWDFNRHTGKPDLFRLVKDHGRVRWVWGRVTSDHA